MIRTLTEFFDKFTKLPIDVNDVRDQLIDRGVQDEINFHFVDIDPAKVRGLLYRYTRHSAPYANPTFCADICIARQMERDWQRLVAIKELLHITDCDVMTAESEEAVNGLVRNLALPPEVRFDEPQKLKPSFVNDKMRVYNALAIMLPATIRTSLRDLHNANKITESEIARMAEIPTRFVPLLMLDDFETLHQNMVGWEDEKRARESRARVRVVE